MTLIGDPNKFFISDGQWKMSFPFKLGQVVIVIMMFGWSVSTLFGQNQKQHCLSQKRSVAGSPKFSVLANNSRSDSVDVLHYTIDLDITDFVGKTINGNCKVDFTSKVNGLNVLYLDLLSLTVSSVKWSDNSSLTFTHNDTLLAITLPATMNISDTNFVTVYYSGTPPSDPTGWGGFLFNGNYAYNIGVGFSVDPHNFGRCWFPCFDNFVERSSYTFKITTDGLKRAHCNGYLQNEISLGGGKVQRTWQMDQEIPSYLACVAVGEYTTLQWNHQGINGQIPVELAAVSSDTASLRSSFIHLDTAISIFENAYGAYRWDKVGYSLVPFNAGAMEHATNIAYPRFVVDGTTADETLMAHELSHHWWGDLVTCERQEEMWLNEGWCKFSEHLFTENVYGRNQYLNEVIANHYDVIRNAHKNDEGYWSLNNIPHAFTYGDHAYNKGALVAHVLRTYLGDSLFFSGITTFLENNQFQDISNTRFRDELGQITGYDLNPFFDGWVLNPGYPHLSVDSVNIVQNGVYYDVYLRVHQSTHEAPGLFSNIPIQVSFVDQDFSTYSQTVVADGLYSDFNFVLDFNPASILLNSDFGIGQAITFDEKVIYSDGNVSYGKGNALVSVNNLTDSMLLRTEYHLVGPNPLTYSNYVLSGNRYWSFYGVVPEGTRLSTNLVYNPTDEADLLNGVTEDSLVLLYRSQKDAHWTEYRYYNVDVKGSVDDKFGFVVIDSLIPGDYAFARGQSTLGIKAKKDQAAQPIFVYPNPVNLGEDIYFMNHQNHKNITVQLFSSTGQLLRSSYVTTQLGKISTGNISAGHYILIFSDKSGLVHSESIVLR